MAIGEHFPEVLDAARLGAEWAWTELWADLAGPVTGYMRSKGVREPEDATAEVFTQIAKSLESFQGSEERFRSWVFTIAHSRLIDQHRWYARRRTEALPPGLDRLDPLSDPAVVYEANDSQARALAMLSSLTPDQAEVVALRVLGDLSLEQVASITGRKVNAVKQLQHRAFESLRRSLSDETVTP
ncbi:MAG: RNA polymerase sigma factor [Acidimicrobiia bacterium]